MNTTIQPLITPERLQSRVSAMAEEIAFRLQPNATVVGLLTGAFVFTADLVRALSRRGATLHPAFMALASYGSGTTSQGHIQLIMDIERPLQGEQVLLVDDIIDTGHTLHFALSHLRAKGAEQILTCVLLDKQGRRRKPFKADFTGFTIPNQFVVGYGLDYDGRYRELPFVGVLPPD